MFTSLGNMTFVYFLNSQSSLTGESGMTEKVADINEESNTSLLDLKNICFMVSILRQDNTLTDSTGRKLAQPV